MSSVVPEGWKVDNLGNYFTLSSGKSKPTRQLSSIITKGNSIPVYGGNGITGYTDSFLLDKQTIVIGRVGEYCGCVHITPKISWITDNALYIKAILKPSDLHFLFYFLDFSNLSKLRSKGGQPLISQQPINDFVAAFPKLDEQKKIASILTSVDEVIETTQRQIDKLQDLKKATMNELLTNGIGHTEFKDSELGRIPKSWDCVQLGDVTIDSAFGPRFSSDLYSDSGNIGCVRTTDIDENWDIDYSTVPLAELIFSDFESHILKDGDLLVTRSGTCGLVDVFQKQSVPMVAAAFLIKFTLNKNVNALFIRYTMMTIHIQREVQLLASGGVQKNLSGSNLKLLHLPKPPIEEQWEILKHIDSINESISLIKRKKINFQSLKKSLMQDLLTGKVRVRIN